MKMNVTTEETKTCPKSTIEKKFWRLYDKLRTYFIPCSSVFNVHFEHVIVHRVVFFHYKHQRFCIFALKISFLKNDCFLKVH